MSLKLKIYAGSVNVLNNNTEKILFRIIIMSFFALALFYVLFLGNMMMNIMERRSLESDLRVLGSEVRDLELTYLSISNDIDLAFSYSLGFKETKANFTTRKVLGYVPIRDLSSNVKIAQNDL